MENLICQRCQDVLLLDLIVTKPTLNAEQVAGLLRMNLVNFQFDPERNRYVIRSLTERNEEIATFREIEPLPDEQHFSGFKVQEPLT